jgi:hypothetical protein
MLLAWDGSGSADPPGLSAAKEQPTTFANGTVSGGRRIGDQAILMARGAPMAGQASQLLLGLRSWERSRSLPFADWRGPSGG